MLADTKLYNVLNVSSITNLLDSYGTGKALFCANIAPSNFSGTDYINFYDSGTYNAQLDWGEYLYTINCRAAKESDSKAIAQAVIDTLRRVFYSGLYFSVQKLATIRAVPTGTPG